MFLEAIEEGGVGNILALDDPILFVQIDALRRGLLNFGCLELGKAEL